MGFYAYFSSVLILILLTSLAYAYDGKDNSSPLGFKFGISRDEATKIIKSQGKEIVDRTTDSKKIRIIVMNGAIVELPVNDRDFQTRLEFFDDKLMSSSLTIEPDSGTTYQELEKELSDFLIDRYGEPAQKEEVLGFTAWTWRVPDLKVVLSTNPNDNSARIQYIHEPLNHARVQEEIKERQREKPSDPAKEMFLDGNYSTPDRYKGKF